MVVEITSGKPIGLVVGEAKHTGIYFTASRPPRVGEYIIVEYPETPCLENKICRYVLGIVESSLIGNPMISNTAIKPDFVEKARQYGADRHVYMIGYARLLSWIETLADKHILYTPRHPPMPGARIYEASDNILQKIFSCRNNACIPIGKLVNHPNVKVHIDVNSIVSRHLAILAVTGAGKSNTVGVLLDRIANQLGGTALVIDMHNEYGDIAGEAKTNRLPPMLNPVSLSIWEYYALLGIDEKANKQRMYLSKAYDEVSSSAEVLKHPEKFLDYLESKLEQYAESDKFKSDRKSIIDVINKLRDLRRRYEGIVLTPEAPINIETYVKPGMVNVLQLGSVDEDIADAVTYHYLNQILIERKKYVTSGGKEGYPVPILVVIEEAHILIPRDRKTLTKSVAARIAREGRKFGVGLTLVSQRPKNIDEDALSQTNNKIILKLVSPEDLRYVQRASETLSDELLEMLPSLNTGEAILLGMMIPIPAIVKIDKHEHKSRGSDINAVEEWMKYSSNSKREEKEENSPINDYSDFIMN